LIVAQRQSKRQSRKMLADRATHVDHDFATGRHFKL
jgi:hypothetical protein